MPDNLIHEIALLSPSDLSRIIEMAWEDRTPFEAIEFQFGLKEKEVILFMRENSLPSSFKMWRERVQGRATKHAKLRVNGIDRFKYYVVGSKNSEYEKYTQDVKRSVIF